MGGVGVSEKMILDYVWGGRGITKGDGWCWERGYVSFLLDYYKLSQNLPLFYVIIMIFIKATIFIFITVLMTKKFLNVLKKVYIRYIAIPKKYGSQKMILAYVEGGGGV